MASNTSTNPDTTGSSVDTSAIEKEKSGSQSTDNTDTTMNPTKQESVPNCVDQTGKEEATKEENQQEPESSELTTDNSEDNTKGKTNLKTGVSTDDGSKDCKTAHASETEISNPPETGAKSAADGATNTDASDAESEDSEDDDEPFEMNATTFPVVQRLLIDAMRLQDMRSVMKLLNLGIDVNSEYESNREKRSLLYYAVDSRSLDMVKLLLEKGANLRPSSDPETKMAYPLHHAALIGNMRIIKYFVEELGIDVNFPEPDGLVPIHAAARNGSLSLIKYLIEKGAKVDAITKDDTAPIHYAASRGYHQLVHELVRRGAPVNAVQVRYDHFDKKMDRTTSLILATCHGSYNVCEYLCMHGAEVNWQDNTGWTALHNASCFNYPYIVDLLLQHGANVNLKSKDGDAPIHAAVHGDRITTVMRLFKGGADINVSNEKGKSAIYESASRYHTFSTWALLDCGVIVNTQQNIRSFSETVIGMKLHEKIDLKDVIRLMLEAGAILETEWLLSLTGSYIVHHCLSLNRLYKHITIPRTLQSCCHLVIRKHIKKPISEHLCELPLPEKVQHEISLKSYIDYRPSSWRWGGDSEYWRKCLN